MPEDLGDFEEFETEADVEEAKMEARRATLQSPPEPRDPLAEEFRLGDPVIDLATGRAMVIVGVPGQTVAEWSGDEDFDLLGVYGNERCRARPNDPVYQTVYTAGVSSEPSGPYNSEGPYTFPSSRLARATIESVEGVRRPYEAVAVDVLDRLFQAAYQYESAPDATDLITLAQHAGFDGSLVREAEELGGAATFGGGESDA